MGEAYFKTEYLQSNQGGYPTNLVITTDGYRSEENKYKKGFFQSDLGWGISGSFMKKSNWGKFIFQVSDVGFIHWRELSVSDTSGNFQFDGLEYNFEANDFVGGLFPELADSLKPNKRTGNKLTLLPGGISATYISRAEKRLFTRFDLSYRYGLNYLPKINGSVNWKYGLNSLLWVNAGVGGFNRYSLGIGSQLFLFNRSYFTLGTDHIIALFYKGNRASNLYFQYTLRL